MNNRIKIMQINKVKANPNKKKGNHFKIARQMMKKKGN
jgi:hypothetical protein